MISLRDYQLTASKFLQAHRRAMVHAPAGSGKTIIGAHALSQALKPGQKAVWICNTQEQREQAGEAMSRVEGPQNVALVIECAAACPNTWDAHIIVVDECHHTPAEGTWLPAVINLRADQRVWGLSATPWHEDEDRNAVVESVFQNFHAIERSLIVESGHLVNGRAYLHDIDRPGCYDDLIDRYTAEELAKQKKRFWMVPEFELRRRIAWQLTQQAVSTNINRNTLIVSLASAQPATLVLVQSVEHGEFLSAQIAGAEVAHSKLAKKKRTSIIERFRSGELPCMVATSLADEGLDVPRAATLVLAAGGRAAGKLEQRIGRVLRPFEGKQVGIVHDFLDRGARLAHAQAKARIKIYERLGCAPSIVAAGEKV